MKNRGKGINSGDASARNLPQPPTPNPQPLTPDPRPLSVAVVGAGRLGTALARALASCGYTVEAVVSRRLSHARRAARSVDAPTGSRTPHALAASQLSLLPPVSILLITTPDDVLALTAASLAAACVQGDDSKNRRDAKNQRDSKNGSESEHRRSAKKRRGVALHASGALSSEVLAPLRACGFSVGSMHPLVAVTGDASAGAESLRRAFYCTEGDPQAVRAARGMVRALGAHSFAIDTRDKALYHAAAVLASGHTVALFDMASQLLARCGLTPARSRRVLLPLLRSTQENLSAHAPSRALTGTFARADVATVRKHLAALEAEGDPAALLVYALLGRRAARLAAENGADAGNLREITRALDEVLND